MVIEYGPSLDREKKMIYCYLQLYFIEEMNENNVGKVNFGCKQHENLHIILLANRFRSSSCFFNQFINLHSKKLFGRLKLGACAAI